MTTNYHDHYAMGLKQKVYECIALQKCALN